MKLRSFVALAPAVALLLAACGGEDSTLTDSNTTTADAETTAGAVTTTTPGATTATGVTTVSPATTTQPGATTLAPTTTMPPNTEAPTTVAPPAVTEPPTTAAAPRPASTDPSTWLLTLEDLGVGWSAAPEDLYYEGGQAEGAAACNQVGPQAPETDLVIAFQEGGDESGAILNESIHTFPDEAAAAAFYASQLDAFRTCTDPVPYDVTERPEIGEAFLVRMEFMGMTRYAGGTVRKGNVVAVVTAISSLDLEPLPPELLALAANKIQI